MSDCIPLGCVCVVPVVVNHFGSGPCFGGEQREEGEEDEEEKASFGGEPHATGMQDRGNPTHDAHCRNDLHPVTTTPAAQKLCNFYFLCVFWLRLHSS